MSNNKKSAIDFWYDFDLLFNPKFGKTPDSIREAYFFESGLMYYWLADREKIKEYPANFIARIKSSQDIVNSIELLAENHLNKIEKIDNVESMEEAFTYFGEGVLYDGYLDDETHQPRRPADERVHMMDDIHFGFPRWHVFCRSAVFLGQDEKTWLKIDRLVATAYAVHMKLDPRQSVPPDGKDPKNPEHPDLVKEVVQAFKSSSFAQLDNQFDTTNVRKHAGHL
jgi:hypothetical protein